LGQERQRTHQQAGVPWISDGRAVYRREIRRTYRDPQRTGRHGRPPLVPTPGVGLTQVVKQRPVPFNFNDMISQNAPPVKDV